jgi:hypothetical protein
MLEINRKFIVTGNPLASHEKNYCDATFQKKGGIFLMAPLLPISPPFFHSGISNNVLEHVVCVISC